MHEHIARAMYYFSVHLLYASIVGAAAWMLTSIRSASGTTKYWIWVVTAFNFTVPIGAIVDKLWAPHLTWAAPLAAIGGPAWSMTQGWTAAVLAVLWVAGAFAMFVRLLSRIRREREAQAPVDRSDPYVPSSFIAGGIFVSFDARHRAPAVCGIFKPSIQFPTGIDRLLNQREFDAVLLHELAHARRRDNAPCGSIRSSGLPEREWRCTANFPAMSPSSSARMEQNWFLRSQNLPSPNQRCLCKPQPHPI